MHLCKAILLIFDIFHIIFFVLECGSSTSCIQQCNINDEDVFDPIKGPCQCNLYKNSSTPIGKFPCFMYN